MRVHPHLQLFIIVPTSFTHRTLSCSTLKPLHSVVFRCARNNNNSFPASPIPANKISVIRCTPSSLLHYYDSFIQTRHNQRYTTRTMSTSNLNKKAFDPIQRTASPYPDKNSVGPSHLLAQHQPTNNYHSSSLSTLKMVSTNPSVNRTCQYTFLHTPTASDLLQTCCIRPGI